MQKYPQDKFNLCEAAFNNNVNYDSTSLQPFLP